MQWIKLRDKVSGLDLTVRLEAIGAFRAADDRDGGTYVFIQGKTFTVCETYEEVRQLAGVRG